ncbi:hypothetical protein [Enterococcus sp. AZ194]|uniref:hypothetical protein n=1 Tax=Enterococcus sp. AZ194 TaxID=2774629 RepID=UPI003F6856AA
MLVHSVAFLLLLCILYVMYLLVTLVIDRLTDYTQKDYFPKEYLTSNEDTTFLLSTYKIWERRKLAYLKEQNRTGNVIKYDGRTYSIQRFSADERVNFKILRFKKPFTRAFVIQTTRIENEIERKL